jgi:uncharacterized protein with NAD-binding domain and iron-sulfur cluster
LSLVLALVQYRQVVVVIADDPAQGVFDRVMAVAEQSRASHVVVVGGGWAGWGAAKALGEAGVRVTLLDGMADPTGSTPLTTATGKPFEAGTRGFWKDYPNINALTAELGLRDVFTDFTTSAFWSPDGLEATAPVFGDAPHPAGGTVQAA